MVDKREELSAPTVYAAASSDGAVTPKLTVSSLAAKASAVVLLLAPPVIFQASFQDLSSTTCLNIEMIMLVPLEVSTLMMPLSMPLSLSLASAPPETLPQGRKKSLPSLVRLPTRPPVGGPQHQTDHIHGDTVSNKSRTLLQTTVHRVPNGHAHLVKATTEEDQCSYHGTTTTDSVEEPSDLTYSTTLTLSPTIQ